MSIRWRLGIAILALLGLVACDLQRGDTPSDPKVGDGGDGKPKVPADITPATMIATAGHGAVFDHRFAEIELTDDLIREIQADMTRLLLEDTVELDPDLMELVKEAQEEIRAKDLSDDALLTLQAASNFALMKGASPKMVEELEWRQLVIARRFEQYVAQARWRVELSPRYARLIEELVTRILLVQSTDYERECREAGVPVPPAWSLASCQGPAPSSCGPWKSHGALQTRMILSSRSAEVYTWTDPNLQGGCILLPRGPDAQNKVAAGLICQGAASGKSCFWDNIPVTDSGKAQQGRIDWRTTTLRTRDMETADTLKERCMDCHSGTNAFNIAPDDATWARVIRPANRTVTPGLTFTTNLTGAVRHDAISSNTGWTNRTKSNPNASCSGCHEDAPVSFGPPPGMLPNGPACIGSGGCYQ